MYFRVTGFFMMIMMVHGFDFAEADILENELLRFVLDGNSGAYTLESKEPGLPGCTGSFGGMVTVVPGEAVGANSLVCASGGCLFAFTLKSGRPFLEVAVSRASDAPAPSSGFLETPVFVTAFNTAPEEIRILGCDGLKDGTASRAGYTFLAAAGPDGKGAVITGWLTQNRASGIALSENVDGKPALRGRAEYGLPRHLPKSGEALESFAVGLFADPLAGLEAYGDAIAEANGIVLNKLIPSGYCTWYSQPHGGACDQKNLAELAAFCAKHLAPFEFNVIQIDDQWQSGRARPKESSGPRLGFLEHHPRGPYRDGIKPAADNIHALGMTPGLWFIPFAGDPANDPAAAHPEWFVKTAGDDPYYVYWAGWSLDMTHPGARDYVRQVTHRITKEWGFNYIKIDGLWSGMATTCLYPEPDYREDDLGGAVFADPSKTNIEAYRDGLALVREAAGDDVFILGCNIAQNMRTLGASMGRVDGMRVGRDIGADWGNILPCVEMGSRLYFLHNRVWYNDPDCLMLREPLTLDQARAWASWIAVSGQMNLVSEWLPGLPAERLDLVKRSMPNHGLNARPLDLFENGTPRTWLLSKGEGAAARHIVAAFNWDAQKEQKIKVPLARLGTGSLSCFEYWSNLPVATGGNTIECVLPPASCKIFALRQVVDHPVVVSTSRHVTQGMVDLLEEEWDESSRTLSGVSRVVGGDPYELRIALPPDAIYNAITHTECEGATIVTRSVQDVVARVRIVSATSAPVAWRFIF